MTRITGKVELVGPFFSKRSAEILRRNVTEYMEEVAVEIGKSAAAHIARGEGGREPIRAIGKNARVSHFVRGRITSIRPAGRRWRLNFVVSPDATGLSARQAIALYAAASRIEGKTHVFRRHARVFRKRARDLARGLN